MTEKQFKSKYRRVLRSLWGKTWVSDRYGKLRRNDSKGLGLTYCECGCDLFDNQDKWIVNGKVVGMEHGMNMIDNKEN